MPLTRQGPRGSSLANCRRQRESPARCIHLLEGRTAQPSHWRDEPLSPVALSDGRTTRSSRSLEGRTTQPSCLYLLEGRSDSTQSLEGRTTQPSCHERIATLQTNRIAQCLTCWRDEPLGPVAGGTNHSTQLPTSIDWRDKPLNPVTGGTNHSTQLPSFTGGTNHSTQSLNGPTTQPNCLHLLEGRAIQPSYWRDKPLSPTVFINWKDEPLNPITGGTNHSTQLPHVRFAMQSRRIFCLCGLRGPIVSAPAARWIISQWVPTGTTGCSCKTSQPRGPRVSALAARLISQRPKPAHAADQLAATKAALAAHWNN